MTERFSQEYIEFVTNSKAIQALWEPKVGDWFYDPDDNEIHLVDEHEEWLVILALGGAESVTWLPTLDDLVRMLAQLAKEKSFSAITLDYVVEGDYWQSAAWTGQGIIDDRSIQDDPELTAARLLERVLEESDES